MRIIRECKAFKLAIFVILVITIVIIYTRTITTVYVKDGFVYMVEERGELKYLSEPVELDLYRHNDIYDNIIYK